MNEIMQFVTYGLALIGVLAFMVSIVVQVIKELPGLTKIPTSIVALVTSLILCPLAMVGLCAYYKIVITWYYVMASFLAAFIVYLVSTGGWEKVKEIWDRTKYKDKEGERPPSLRKGETNEKIIYITADERKNRPRNTSGKRKSSSRSRKTDGRTRRSN